MRACGLASAVPSPRLVPVRLTPRRLFALKALLAAVALGLLVGRAHPAEVAARFLEASPLWALAALALLPANVGLEAYRWWRLVRHLAPEVSYGQALVAVVGSYPLGLLTPGRVGDYVGRALYVRELAPGASAALTFGERMATLAACLVGGLVALAPYLAAHAPPSPLWPALTFATALGTGALLALLLIPDLAQRVLSALVPVAAVRRALGAFGAVPRGEAAALVALSGLRYLVFSAQFVCLVQAFAPGAPWGGAALAVALTFYAKSAVPQVTLGDLGVRESAAVFFLGAYGVGAAAALNASLAVFAVNLLLPAVLGVPLLLRLRLRAPEPAPEAATVRERA